MLLAALLAASVLPLHPLDKVWAQLARDAAAGDSPAFAANRTEIVHLDRVELERWGAKPYETYRGDGYTVSTFTGPTRARGERRQSAYFAIVAPDGDLQVPTFWEVTPGFSPGGGVLWFLTVSGCDLSSGESLVGHVKFWRTLGFDQPPRYEEFKASLAPLTSTRGSFPTDTTVSASPGATCLYVGNIDAQPVFPTPAGP